MKLIVRVILQAALTSGAVQECLRLSKVPPQVSLKPTSTWVLQPSKSNAGGLLTIGVTNKYRAPLSLSLTSNAGAPSPINDPPAAPLSQYGSTQYLFPTGWAGRINVGPNLNPNGSKIEASFTGPPNIDVSYVDGFSVPVTCSVGDRAICGCNIDLFQQPGIYCPNRQEGPVCANTGRFTPDGPALPFFAACSGAAYTFPNDNIADVDMGSTTATCCIGNACRPSILQLRKSQSNHARNEEAVRSGYQ